MPSSERVSAGEAAAAARERRDVARREEGKERDAGLGFAVPRWSKRSGSWDVVEETAMAEEGGREDEEQQAFAVGFGRPLLRYRAVLSGSGANLRMSSSSFVKFTLERKERGLSACLVFLFRAKFICPLLQGYFALQANA